MTLPRDTVDVVEGLESDDFFRNTEARQYRIAAEPVIRNEAVAAADRRPLLIHMHTEALTAWRQLVDVRFKLLALVPSISVLALTQLLDFEDSTPPANRWARVAIAVIGFVVVAGLAIYDRRNSELHDDLISRARRAEAELGVHTGVMLGRRLSHAPIQHDVATNLIYGISLFAWLVAAGSLLVHAVS